MKKISNSPEGAQNSIIRVKFLIISVISGYLLSSGGNALAAPMQQSSFFRNNSIIVYGSQNKTTVKDEAMAAFNLKKLMKSADTMTADTRLNETAMHRSNLIILSSGRSNSILNFGNYVATSLPVEIKPDYFVFGGKSYSDKKDGIAFIYPSPFNAKNYVLVYHSNSVEGLDSLVKNAKISYENDYQLLDETGKTEREGKFNKKDFSWGFDQKLDKDYAKSAPVLLNMKTKDSPNFKFYFSPDSYAAARIDSIVSQYETYYSELGKTSETVLSEKVNVYLYDSPAKRTDDSKPGEIAAVFNSKENDALTQLARFYFNNILGLSNDQLMESGFVNYARDLNSGNLDPKISQLYRQNKIPNLLFLIKRETTTPDSDIIVGSFTKYLINKYGMENYKAIINKARSLDTADELSNITPDLYTSFSRIEREWKYTLSDLAKKYHG